MPQLCWTMWKKNNLQRLLFSEISHRRKELRLSNLIHLGLLCLNPWSKVFNQRWGDRGRRLCVGSPGCRAGGRRGAEPWSITEPHPAREEPARHCSTPALGNAKQLTRVGHFRTLMIIKTNPKTHSHTKWRREVESVGEERRGPTPP